MLYWAAITKAIDDIFHYSTSNNYKPTAPSLHHLQRENERTPSVDLCTLPSTNQKEPIITCLVFGAGMGRLVQYCIDALYPHSSVSSCIHVADANPLAVRCLKEYFSDYISSEGALTVVVHDAFTLFPGMQRYNLPCGLNEIYRKCDLIVSELLGCFGCDEFLPELTSTLCNLFLKCNGVCIPKNWSSYIAPIQSHCFYNSLSNQKSLSMYTVGIPSDCIFLSEPKIIWKRSCVDYQTPHCDTLAGIEFSPAPFMVRESGQTLTASQKNLQVNVAMGTYTIHGLIGYFTSCLYDDIYIDTRHNAGRNSFHWECFYMPLKYPMPFCTEPNSDRTIITASVKRTCGIVKPVDNARITICDGLGLRLIGMGLGLKYSWKVKIICSTDGNSNKCEEQSVDGNSILLSYNMSC